MFYYWFAGGGTEEGGGPVIEIPSISLNFSSVQNVFHRAFQVTRFPLPRIFKASAMMHEC